MHETFISTGLNRQQQQQLRHFYMPTFVAVAAVAAQQIFLFDFQKKIFVRTISNARYYPLSIIKKKLNKRQTEHTGESTIYSMIHRRLNPNLFFI